MGSHPYRAEQSTKIEFCLGATCDSIDAGVEDSGQSEIKQPAGCAVVRLSSFKQPLCVLFIMGTLVCWRRKRYGAVELDLWC